jgi:hypothetical protein
MLDSNSLDGGNLSPKDNMEKASRFSNAGRLSCNKNAAVSRATSTISCEGDSVGALLLGGGLLVGDCAGVGDCVGVGDCGRLGGAVVIAVAKPVVLPFGSVAVAETSTSFTPTPFSVSEKPPGTLPLLSVVTLMKPRNFLKGWEVGCAAKNSMR